jgi:hypothetical protein
MRRKIRQFYTGVVALLVATLFLGLQPASSAQAQSAPQWQDTGVNLAPAGYCADSGRKDRLVYLEYSSEGKSANIGVLDLQTRQNTVLSKRAQSGYVCGSKGILYIRENTQAATDTIYMINTLDGKESKIEHLPTHVAVDGSRYAYYFQSFSRGSSTKAVLKTSADGGLTWQERGQQFNGYIRSFMMSRSDARVVYALVQSATPQADGKTAFSIYVSRDAGATWEVRYQSAEPEDSSRGGIPYFLSSFTSYQTPSDFVRLTRESGGFGSSSRSTYFVSADGARTFSEVGTSSVTSGIIVEYSAKGFVRYQSTTTVVDSRYAKLEYSADGKEWSAFTLPLEAVNGINYAFFEVVPTSGSIIMLRRFNKIWVSADGGKNWNTAADSPQYESAFVTPYAPTALIAITANNRIFKLDLSQYDRVQTQSARANNLVADNIYFPETGHNLSGVFRRYWEANGGLAQFSYPKTEPFPEFNPADGKTYVVQYFERNRFEYHPELAGTKFEVLLGLLGNQMTEKQRAEGNGAFNRFQDMKYPGGVYFPETGHNLRNSFKAYWEQYGGLAIYGYPTSEEFEEVNPDDGKTYVVQYFERARFEFHPENRGTKFEVLLGLLGNALLRQKGWLS